MTKQVLVAVCLLALLASACLQSKAFAQFSLLNNIEGPPDRREPPLIPAPASHLFPLSAQMQGGRSHYIGDHSYKGSGTLTLAGQSYFFRYDCAYSFRIRHLTYAARWIKEWKKLEILTAKPDSNHVEPCRLTTKPTP